MESAGMQAGETTKKLDSLVRVQPILKCVDCGGEDLRIKKGDGAGLSCERCGRAYPLLESGILNMLPTKGLPEPAIYQNADYVKFMKCYAAEGLSMVLAERNKIFHWIHHYGHAVVKRFSDRQPNAAGWSLDLGCGSGDHLNYINDHSKIIALDILAGPLEVARKRHPGVFTVQGDGCRLPFKDNVFDKIYSIHNLEHIYYLEEVLSEVNRTMSADRGRFYVVLPTEGSLIWHWGRKLLVNGHYSKKYGVDYMKVMKVEHCNTLKRALSACSGFFNIERKRVFPFFFLPLIDINLICIVSYSKKSRGSDR